MWKIVLCFVAVWALPGCTNESCDETGSDAGKNCDSGDRMLDGLLDDDPTLDPDPETFSVTWLDACTVMVGVDRSKGTSYRFGIHDQGDDPYIGEACIANPAGICHTAPTEGYRTLASVNDTACGGAGKAEAAADSATFVHRDMSLVFTFYDDDDNLMASTCGGCE